MKKIMKFFCLLLSLLGLITGCNQDKENVEDIKTEPLLPSAGTYNQKEIDGGEEVINNEHLNELHKGLIGTFWQFEEFDIRFLSKDKLHIKGGVVNKLSPKGIEAEYKLYDDGVIEIMVLGMIKTGMWDGKKLVIDGLIGTKKE
ncbi:MAG: hypothetical protein ACP5KS_06510 [Candidatus Hydrogenedens sp.]